MANIIWRIFPLHSFCLMALATNAVSAPSDQLSRALCADLMLALFPSRGFDRMCHTLLAFDVFPPAFYQLCFWIFFKLCLICRKVFAWFWFIKLFLPCVRKTTVLPSLLLALAFFKPTFSPKIPRFWDFTKIFTSPPVVFIFFHLAGSESGTQCRTCMKEGHRSYNCPLKPGASYIIPNRPAGISNCHQTWAIKLDWYHVFFNQKSISPPPLKSVCFFNRSHLGLNV